jgi:hypothetical protein
MAAAAVAMVHGLRGDNAARTKWLAVVDELGVGQEESAGYSAVFDAIVLLHDGHADQALTRMAADPDEMDEQVIWFWRHWYLALRAEAATLAGAPDARDRVTAARNVVVGNPIAEAQLDRAEALLDGDQARMLAAATAFETAGCRYQRARTLVLAGDDAGAQAMADLGLAPATVAG